MIEEVGINFTDTKVEDEVRIAIKNSLSIELPLIFTYN